MNQTREIKTLIMLLIDSGLINKQAIYNEIQKNHPEIPRPSIRRACRQLRIDLETKIKILQSYDERSIVETEGK